MEGVINEKVSSTTNNITRLRRDELEAAAGGEEPEKIKNFEQKDKDVIKHFGKKIGPVKFVRIFMKLFRKFCPSCRNKAQQNPKRELEDYCSKCRRMIRKLLEGYL